MIDSHEVKYVSLLGSAAHTYGNALAVAQKWVIDLFPENTFKTIHVNSKIAHRQILSTTHEFLKKTKPIIIFRPRISYDEDRFLNHTYITERLNDVYDRGTLTDLQPFFMDNKNNIAIKYTLNRYVMYIDVSMIFSTMIQQINYIQYLKNSTRINIPFDIDTFLESYLPKDMMELISTLSGIPLKDEEGSTKPFLDYMNSNSYYPITYKLQGSTNSDEYYRYYPAKIVTMISDISADDGNRVGQASTNYQVNFTMRMEFYATGFNYLFSDKIHKIPKPKIPNDSTLIPVFTDTILYEDLNLAPGWQMFNHATCRLDKEYDSVDFKNMLNRSIVDAAEYHKKHGLPLVEMLDIKIRRQGELITENEDYSIDFDKYTINFKNKIFGYHTYNIIISINVHYINELIKSIYNLK